ncbi:hypothetical protein [Nocardia sp. NPDC056000]
MSERICSNDSATERANLMGALAKIHRAATELLGGPIEELGALPD